MQFNYTEKVKINLNSEMRVFSLIYTVDKMGFFEPAHCIFNLNRTPRHPLTFQGLVRSGDHLNADLGEQPLIIIPGQTLYSHQSCLVSGFCPYFRVSTSLSILWYLEVKMNYKINSI